MKNSKEEIINQNIDEKQTSELKGNKLQEDKVEETEIEDISTEINEKSNNIKEQKEDKITTNNNITPKELENISQIEKDKKSDIDDKNNIQIQKEEKNKEYKGKQEYKKIFSLKYVIFIILLIIFLLCISTVFAILNMGNSNIVNGVYIENIDVSNLKKEELSKIINEKLNNIEDIELNYGEYSTTAKLEEISVEVNADEAKNKALSLGRTDNIIEDNYSILIANIFKTKFELSIKIDENKFNEAIKNIQAEIPEAIKEYSYYIKDKELIITNGEIGQKIIAKELKEKIVENIKNQFNGKKEIINIPTKLAEPPEINIEKIYSEIFKEPKDAYILEGKNEEIVELHKEEYGIDFAISINDAKKMLKEEKEKYTIPLKITEPKIKITDLGDKLFKQTLAKYTTIYDAGNKNRSHNIALAAKTINGTILMPGETFSYNGILGNTNKEKGYKLGTAYVGGKVVESYGGGICQVSSTLYNTVLYANLEIVERYNHSYIVNYVPAGRDATVAYGGKDFKFKNTRNYPIKIVSSAKNGVVSISIKGLKEETEYEVVLTSTVLSTTPRSVKYENNSNMEEGTQKIIQKGYDGKKSIAYKILKLNGKTISKTVLSKDTYKPMTQIIQVGTKKVTITAPETDKDTI